jgi:hypothetical protein
MKSKGDSVVTKKDFSVPLFQDPLIYQRVLNHPELAFPNRFIAARPKIKLSNSINAMAEIDDRV